MPFLVDIVVYLKIKYGENYLLTILKYNMNVTQEV